MSLTKSNTNRKLNKSKLIILLSLILLISFTGKANSYIAGIYKHDAFWIVSNFPEFTHNTQKYKICFTNLHPRTKYINLMETTVEDLSDFINASSVMLHSMDVTYSQIITDPSKNFIEDHETPDYNKKIIAFKIKNKVILDKTIQPINYYCMTFNTIKPINTFKNLKISTSSSAKINNMEYQMIYNFSAFNIYNAATSDALSIYSSDFSKNEANLSDDFSANFNFAVDLPENKQILTMNSMFVVLELTNLDISKSTVTSQGVGEEPLLTNLKSFDLTKINYSENIFTIAPTTNTSILLLDNFSENLVKGRKFRLNITSLKFIQNSDSLSTVKVLVLWKNTNSVVSSFKYTINVTCVKYKFDVDSTMINHINNYPYLYSNSAFPVEVSFKLNESTEKDIIITTTAASTAADNFNKHLIHFIPSTCEFYLTGSKDAFCIEEATIASTGTKSTSKLIVKKPKINKNTTFKLRVWILINGIDFDAGQTVPITIEIAGFSDVYTFPAAKLPKFVTLLENSFKHEDVDIAIESNTCIDDFLDDFSCEPLENVYTELMDNYADFIDDYDTCWDELQSLKATNADCLKLLKYSRECVDESNVDCFREYRVVNELATAVYLLDSDRSPQVISNLVNSKLKIRNVLQYRYDASENYCPNFYLWNTEYAYSPSSTNQTNEKRMIKGSHSFYFPVDFTKIEFTNSDTEMRWYSSHYMKVTDGSPTEIGINYSSSSGVSTTPRNVKDNKISVASSSIDSVIKNKISINNYSDTGINLGLFYHHLYNYKTSDGSIVNKRSSNTLHTAAAADAHVENNLEFDFVKILSYESKSIFSTFDFIHSFTRKGELLPCRINRFINLLPQRGIFNSNVSTFSISASPINYAQFIVNSGSNSNICLLELNFSSINDSEKSKDLTLVLYLEMHKPIRHLFLDFQNLMNYPVSNGKAKVYNKQMESYMVNYTKNRMFPPTFTYNSSTGEYTAMSAPFNTEYSATNFADRTPAFYYLGDRLELTEISFSKSVVVPYICNSNTATDQGEKQKLEIAMNSFKQSNDKYTSFKKVSDRSFYKILDIASLDNKSNATIELINNKQYVKIGYNDVAGATAVKGSTENEYNQNTRYLVLLLNYTIKDTKFLNNVTNELTPYYPNQTTNDSFATRVVTDNPVTYDNRVYNNFYFIYNLKTDINFAYNQIVQTVVTPKINISGITVPIEKGIKAKNAAEPDIYFTLTYIKPGANNYGQNILYGNGLSYIEPEALDTLSQFITLSVTTTNIKTPDNQKASNYICAKMEVKVFDNTTKIKVFSESLLNTSIYMPENFEGDYASSAGSVEIVIFSRSTNSITISACNINYTINKFSVTKLEIYSSNHKTHTFSNSNTPVVNGNVPSANNYESNKISFYGFNNARKTYTELLMIAQLNHEVFRNMKIMISFDKGDDTIKNKLLINSDLAINCEVFFEDFSEKNAFFETCLVDLTSDYILITTENLVITNPGGISNKFSILLWPVYRFDLNETSITIKTGYNELPFNGVFIEESKFPVLDSTSPSFDSTSTFIINSSITFESLEPFLPNMIGKIKINVNLVNNNLVLTYLEENNQPILNETAFYFPASFYGLPNENLQCYLNSIEVTNCIFEKNWIYIRSNVAVNVINSFEIYGFVVQNLVNADKAKSKFLVQINTVTSTSRTTWLEGIGSINSTYDLTKYDFPVTEFINIAVLSQSVSQNFPNSSADVSIHFTQDRLVGLKSQNLAIADIANTDIYVEIPKQISFNPNTTMNLYILQRVKLNTNDTGSISQVSGDVVVIDQSGGEAMERKELILKEIKFYGKLIKATITSPASIDENLRKFVLVISSVNTPVSEQRIGNFNIVLTRADLYMATLPVLATFNSVFNNQKNTNLEEYYFDEFTYEIDTTYLSTLKSNEISVSYNYIKYYRGLDFYFQNNRFYFEYSNSLNSFIKPGIYTPIELSLKKRGNVSDITKSTTVSINKDKSTLFETPKDSVFSIDGLLNKTVSILVGIPCGTLPGNYFLQLSHSDTTNSYFSSFTPLTFTVRHMQEYEFVNFYYSNKSVYKPGTPITLGKGGIIYFFTQLSMPAMNEITVVFNSDKENGTSLPSPASITIGVNKTDYVVSSFISTDPNIDSTQRYHIQIKGSACYKSNIEYVEFLPNFELKAVSSSLQLASIISFENKIGDNAISLKRNQLKFTFDGRAVDMPNGSNLFCSLYCADIMTPEDKVLTMLPQPENNWFANYVYFNVVPSSIYNHIFDNLARNINYKLKCILKSGHYKEEEVSQISVNLDTIGKAIIAPVPTQTLKCIDIFVKNIDPAFKIEAQTVIQNNFNTNYIEDGCITIIDDNFTKLPNYGDVILTCSTNSSDNSDSSSTESTDVTSTDTASASDEATSDTASTQAGRFLQGTNTSTTDATTTTTTSTDTVDSEATDSATESTESTESSEETQNVVKPSYLFCFVQYAKCPNDVDVKEFDDKIKKLFTEVTINNNTNGDTVVNNITRRQLQNSSTFTSQLSNQFRNNYNGFSFVFPNDEDLISYLNTIKVINQSDFKVKNEDVRIDVTISTTMPNKLKCYFAISHIAVDSELIPSKDEIINCDKTKTVFCGNFEGEILGKEINYNKFVNSSFFLYAESFTVWAVCKQNIPIATTYSIPRALDTFEVVIDDSENVVVTSASESCIYTSPNFPKCCTFGVEADNIKICANSGLDDLLNKKVIYLLILVIMALLY